MAGFASPRTGFLAVWFADWQNIAGLMSQSLSVR
jgi:hypothetical protein